MIRDATVTADPMNPRLSAQLRYVKKENEVYCCKSLKGLKGMQIWMDSRAWRADEKPLKGLAVWSVFPWDPWLKPWDNMKNLLISQLRRWLQWSGTSDGPTTSNMKEIECEETRTVSNESTVTADQINPRLSAVGDKQENDRSPTLLRVLSQNHRRGRHMRKKMRWVFLH